MPMFWIASFPQIQFMWSIDSVTGHKLVEFLEAEKAIRKLSQFKDKKAEKEQRKPGMRLGCRTYILLQLG